WKGKPLANTLNQYGAAPKNWAGTLGADAAAKLSEAVPLHKLLPGQKPDVISLLLDEGDDITRAWDRASNPFVCPVFIGRDPNVVDVIINGVAYRRSIEQSASTAQRMRQAPLRWSQDPTLQPSPYPDAPPQGIALHLAPIANQ